MENKNVNTFYISGYWKDTKEKFENYKVVDIEWDGIESDEDDSIFFYELSEEEIKESIRKGEDESGEFVITSYTT